MTIEGLVCAFLSSPHKVRPGHSEECDDKENLTSLSSFPSKKDENFLDEDELFHFGMPKDL